MSASQRVSRGFHRLALFLAAIPLILGVVFAVYVGNSEAQRYLVSHKIKVSEACANERLCPTLGCDQSSAASENTTLRLR